VQAKEALLVDAHFNAGRQHLQLSQIRTQTVLGCQCEKHTWELQTYIHVRTS